MADSQRDSLAQLCLDLQAGRRTAADAVDGYLDRIAAIDPRIEAWAYVAQDEARQEARELDREFASRGCRGPLHGVPFGVKDIFDTAGMPTEWGTPTQRGRVPREDAALVAQLRRAGAIVLGKTHTTAFAYFDPGPTRNPHNTDFSPGGSSSGSAAAVAAGMAPFAIGSQTMGSVLRPASFCGIAGMKPTFDSLPLGGVMEFAKSLDHAGFFTKSIEDMRHLWSAYSGKDIASTARPPSWIHVPWPIEDGLEPEMEEAFGALIERLRVGGLPIEERPLPATFRGLLRAARTINNYEGARANRERYEQHGVAIGLKLAALVEDGLTINEQTYRGALETVARARAEFEASTADGSVWFVPAAPGTAPAGIASTGDPRCNAPFTSLGVPALSVPFARTGQGLPLGCQIVASAGREDLLLAAGRRCEDLLEGFAG
ncbi:MAG: amidase [Acidobacteria bacterium]|nr:amidase [Acidobacteriota bacterium]